MAKKTGRSLQLTPEQLVEANRALSQFGTKSDLAAALGMSRTTINKFFKGEPVQVKNFHAICKKLKFDWQPEAEKPAKEETGSVDLDALVQEMRDRIRPFIQERCGTMRVLDMAQPIGLGEIYTHVNILEKITARRGLKLDELAAQMSSDEFDRFSLGEIREEQIPGLEAVERHSKLMILGKPGAGKTTFLKHLAMQCIGGEFQGDRIPLFVTLKEFAETHGQPDLLTYLESLVVPFGKFQNSASGNAPKSLPTLLSEGQALILLDGLDEVREADASRVLHQVKHFSERHPHNALVMTCRIAARDYTFESFTEVEVADFNDRQIAEVSESWFRCRQDEVKAERLLTALKENPPIRDLASSPLLLTLLCLVFEDSGEFPANRAELYENGVDVLLKKWDVKRNIERDQVYKKLSLRRKEDLLSQIAYRTFEAGQYFFKKKELERQIQDFIEHLPGASTDEQTLELDSEAVLKSIEAQHGLFVERARGIYSFSHLTFHEYFAAREIKEKARFTALAAHITEKRWREVVLLTIGMMPHADKILRGLKQAIDGLLAKDEQIQAFLVWLCEKSKSTSAPYKTASIRAFYYILDRALVRDPIRALVRDLVHDLARDLDRALARDLDRALVYNRDRALVYNRDRALARDLDLDFTLARARDRDLNLNFVRASDRDRDLTRDLDLDLDLACALVRASQAEDLDNARWGMLMTRLDKLREQLPQTDQTLENIRRWWHENWEVWVNQLRSVMVEYRDAGYDWQFSNAQKAQLEKYYEANKLLVDCLNSDCYVSRGVREEIEDTLLLPIAEIERRKAQKAQS
ncbi:MAG: NACHT domain-containing NTPase [Cyanobacteria bacterium J06638_20]